MLYPLRPTNSYERTGRSHTNHDDEVISLVSLNNRAMTLGLYSTEAFVGTIGGVE
jgi:hypothetical protein